jgi:hypothetical protein
VISIPTLVNCDVMYGTLPFKIRFVGEPWDAFQSTLGTEATMMRCGAPCVSSLTYVCMCEGPVTPRFVLGST